MYAWVLSLSAFTNAFGQSNEEEPVSVTYRKDCIYADSHDNIPGLRQYVLYRDKTYADGKVVTEASRSTFWFPCDEFHHEAWRGEYDTSGDRYWYDLRFRYGTTYSDVDDLYGRNGAEYGQIYRVWYNTIGVPDLSKLKWKEYESDDKCTSMQDFKRYLKGNVYFNPDALEDMQEGWYYFNDNWAAFEGRLIYEVDDDPIVGYVELRRDCFAFQNIGYLLYADGHIFDFYDFKPTYDAELRIKDATMPNGAPAKIYTYECRKKYTVGPDKYVAVVDTFYQLSPEEAKHWKPVPQTISLQFGNKKENTDKQRPEAVIWEQENAIWQKVEDD